MEIRDDQRHYFKDPEAAPPAGYRPCATCDPLSLLTPIKQDLEKITAAISAWQDVENRRAFVGNKVTIQFLDGEEQTFRLVTDDEPRAGPETLSVSSPLGGALLEAREGDTVTYRAPKGDEQVTVIRIE